MSRRSRSERSGAEPSLVALRIELERQIRNASAALDAAHRAGRELETARAELQGIKVGNEWLQRELETAREELKRAEERLREPPEASDVTLDTRLMAAGVRALGRRCRRAFVAGTGERESDRGWALPYPLFSSSESIVSAGVWSDDAVLVTWDGQAFSQVLPSSAIVYE